MHTTRAPIAIIPAAGRPSRHSHTPGVAPRELTTVGGRPALVHVLEEAAAAGLDRAAVVTSPGNLAVEAYLRSVASPVTGGSLRFEADAGPIEVVCVDQREPVGLGDAIATAARALGVERAVVLLPDELFLGPSNLIEQLLALSEITPAGAMALREVGAEISDYGSVGALAAADGTMRVVRCLEKPLPGTAPSTVAICGRYVLGEAVITELVNYPHVECGEVQLTAALDAVASRFGLGGLRVDSLVGRHEIARLDTAIDGRGRRHELAAAS